MKHSAFTLIEAIIAVMILSIAIPAMLAAIRTTHDKRSMPLMVARARWLAAEKLEDIIADRNSTTRGFSYLATANYPTETSIASYPGFTRSVTLNQTGPDLTGAGVGYMNVTVTVTWTDEHQAAQSLAISTVVTDYTP